MSNTPQAKTERLMNVVMCLRHASRPMTKAQLRDAIEPYRQADNSEAFDRMFERDKEELRELGVPLRTQDLPVPFDDEQGYLIAEADYALPEVDFTAQERAVLGLAARAWSHQSMASAATQGLRKLETTSQDQPSDAWVESVRPNIGAGQSALPPLLEANLARQVVTFDYRSKPTAEPVTRRVQPWGVLLWRGRWYVAGWDEDRQAERVFRLSRMSSTPRTIGSAGAFEIPNDFDAQARVASADPPQDPLPAIIRVRVGAGSALRASARTIGGVDADWDLIDLDYERTSSFAAALAAYAGDVVVEQPEELRAAVIAILTGAAS